ncbi:MAG: anti-sigma factor [Myxococcota bacterium]
MTEHLELRELAVLHALGVLEGEDETRFLAHVAEGCSECEAAVREARTVGDALAGAVPPVPPSREGRDRLLARVHADAAGREARREPGIPRWRPALGLAAGLALVALGGLSLRLALSVGEERERRISLEQTLAGERSARGEAEDARRVAEQELAAARDTLEVLTGAGARTLALAGTGPAGGASARAFVDPERGRLLLYVYDLPPAPPGRTYQVWVLVGDRPVSAGVFDVSPEGGTSYDAQEVDDLAPGVGVAVTIEPEGGVPAPTGPMVLVGS